MPEPKRHIMPRLTEQLANHIPAVGTPSKSAHAQQTTPYCVKLTWCPGRAAPGPQRAWQAPILLGRPSSCLYPHLPAAGVLILTPCGVHNQFIQPAWYKSREMCAGRLKGYQHSFPSPPLQRGPKQHQSETLGSGRGNASKHATKTAQRLSISKGARELVAKPDNMSRSPEPRGRRRELPKDAL